MGVLVDLRNLEIGYERVPLLEPINLKLSQGEFWGVVGPNGSGKTTLLKTLLGLIRPLSGEVSFPAGKAPAFGYVPQAGTIDTIYPVTAREVVELGRAARYGITRRLRPKDKEAIQKALAQTEADSYADRPYRDLSGGQKQRVLLARALATDPEILLLDEPISGMDLAGETAIMELIRQLGREKNLAIVMISHALSVVANYAEKLLLLDRNHKKTLQGPVREVLQPEKLKALYGIPIAIQEVWGWTTIFADLHKAPQKEVGHG